ncbi:septal ring lytic transglycosylase RlpA family protein [Hymenobacter properus]|uniref:Probable endolytic peptidoglycan transglycosylase RlpA n=1 Tax=Hymenobacter properus TaxID=2791026 RepID=A0A931BI70_9BACT|nr:septal ring lytic transglycosylase RlpA family protein [Hymenobacter properus]MBF9142956.1 septal ring lytic transglycosylase RlpA family protein [Hymenobacter properus]MBR7721763.1 septal ring lytic transglycosylase RlpA family protein [Microvirga sp. SRT04]
MILFRRSALLVLSSCFFFLLSFLSAPAHATTRRTTKSTVASAPSVSTTVLRGRASWYASSFQGRRTTSGERYNRNKYTCAHKTLPFGTRLRVTNVKNGKSVVVRVSDRGPFRHQRILDLSEIAARPLGITECGAATVVAEVVADETPLGPATTPENLAALYAADPDPEAAFTTYSVSTLPAVNADSASVDAHGALIAASGTAKSKVISTAETVNCPAGFLIQAGSFVDAANATAVQARIKALMPELKVEIAQELLDGRQRSRVLVGQFGEKPEAEAVRQQLLLWGIGGLVREVALR